MEGAARLLREAQVALNLAPLALGAYAPVAVRPRVGPVVDVPALQERIHLAVRGEEVPRLRALRHAAAHHVLVLHAAPVVGEGRGQAVHTPDIRHLAALFAHGQRAVGIDLDEGVPLDYRELLRQTLRAVRHRVQVRHGAEGRVPAPRGRRRAGRNRLLIRKTRLSQMNMDINKTGKNTAIIEIENRNAVRGNDTGLHAGDNAAGDLKVGGNKTPLEEHFAALYDELIHPETSSQTY